jgi:hypothetical protein
MNTLPSVLTQGIWLAVALTACANAPDPSRAPCLENPPQVHLPSRMEPLVPAMLDWYNRTEAGLLDRGRVLLPQELAMARDIGVAHPDRVRVVVAETFPMPEDPALRREAARLGLDTLPVSGRAMGYVILLKPDVAGQPTVLAHELTHIAQMERLGREVFLRRYFAELAEAGYACSPLEREARAAAAPYRD